MVQSLSEIPDLVSSITFVRTEGPYALMRYSDRPGADPRDITVPPMTNFRVMLAPGTASEEESDAAVFARAVVAGVARWEFFDGSDENGEVCVGGIRYCTRLNAGVPILFHALREALERHTCFKLPTKAVAR